MLFSRGWVSASLPGRFQIFHMISAEPLGKYDTEEVSNQLFPQEVEDIARPLKSSCRRGLNIFLYHAAQLLSLGSVALLFVPASTSCPYVHLITF